MVCGICVTGVCVCACAFGILMTLCMLNLCVYEFLCMCVYGACKYL